MEQILATLSRDIGVRFGGSPQDAESARRIHSSFENLGLNSWIQKYKMIGWRAVDKPLFRIHSPEEQTIESAHFLYSASTPPNGVSGQLQRYGKAILIPGVFELETLVLRSEQGEELARIYIRDTGPAIPLQNPRPMYRLPQIVIGDADGQKLLRKLNAGAIISATLDVRGELLPDAWSHNVIAEYRGGDTKERIIVCAHHDTTVGSPGAYDNASGIAGLMNLARRLITNSYSGNIDFIAFGSQEGGFWGSNYHVNVLKEQNRLSEIKAVINLDQICAGDLLWVWAGPSRFRQRVERCLRDAGYFDRYDIQIDPPKPGTDDFAFAREGVPTASFIFWVPPYYHTAEDTLEKVDWTKLEDCIDAVEQLLCENNA